MGGWSVNIGRVSYEGQNQHMVTIETSNPSAIRWVTPDSEYATNNVVYIYAMPNRGFDINYFEVNNGDIEFKYLTTEIIYFTMPNQKIKVYIDVK
jgi:hypothetical protein